MMKRLLLFLCAIALIAAGCGSSKKSAEPTVPLPRILPPAQTSDEWALRVVNDLLRPLNRDFVVVNGFNDPNVIVYIANRNQTTLQIVRNRLGDLAQCSNKLVAIGPPPPSRKPLARVNSAFQKACTTYVELAQQLAKATLFLSSGRTDVIAEGRKLLRTVRPTNNAAGAQFTAAIKLAQNLPEFRRAGLKQSF